MNALKIIWTNWKTKCENYFRRNLCKRINSTDAYFILLDVYLVVQVFSESLLNELAIIAPLLKVFRIIILLTLAINAAYSLRLNSVSLPQEKRKNSIINIFLYAFVILCLMNSLVCDGGQNLLGVTFAVIAAKEKPLKRIFKNTLISLTAAHALIFFLSLIGVIHDNIDVRWIGNQTGALFQGEYVRHAFGFLHSNQIPLIFMLLLFMYAGIRGREFTVAETVFAAAVNYALFLCCGSRISLILGFAFLGCIWFVRICELKCPNKLANCLVVGYAAYPVACFTSLIGSYAYNANSSFWVKADLVLNNRLSLAHRLLEVYPVTLLGYGKYAGTYLGLGEATADNGYVLLFLQAGSLISVMVLILHECMMHICIKKECATLVVCLIFIAIENMINAHMPSYKLIPLYCILMSCKDTVFADYKSKNTGHICFFPDFRYLK